MYVYVLFMYLRTNKTFPNFYHLTFAPIYLQVSKHFQILNGRGTLHLTIQADFVFKSIHQSSSFFFPQGCCISMQIQRLERNGYVELHGL